MNMHVFHFFFFLIEEIMYSGRINIVTEENGRWNRGTYRQWFNPPPSRLTYTGTFSLRQHRYQQSVIKISNEKNPCRIFARPGLCLSNDRRVSAKIKLPANLKQNYQTLVGGMLMLAASACRWWRFSANLRRTNVQFAPPQPFFFFFFLFSCRNAITRPPLTLQYVLIAIEYHFRLAHHFFLSFFIFHSYVFVWIILFFLLTKTTSLAIWKEKRDIFNEVHFSIEINRQHLLFL